MTMRTLLNAMSYITIGLFLMAMVFFWVTFLWPYQPVIWHDKTFPIVTHQVKAGEQVEFIMSYTKNMDVVPTVVWYLVDGTVVRLSQGGITRPIGTSTIHRSLLIPMSTFPGTYHIQLEITYEIYPWRKIYFVQSSDDFKVIK